VTLSTFEANSSTVPSIVDYLRVLWARRHFMEALVGADLRAAGANTTLGNLWSVLNPLLQAGIYYFLYAVLRSDASRSQFLPVLIADFFLFNLSMSALYEGGSSIRRAKGLMLNSTLPRALLPVSTVYKSIRSFVPAACLLVVIFPLLGGTVGSGVLVLPLLFALQVVMNVGIALLVSTFVVLVPDVGNVMSYVNRIAFFATPVISPVRAAAGGGKGRPPLATPLRAVRQLSGDPRGRHTEPRVGGSERVVCSSAACHRGAVVPPARA
jgi:teichoic acid transport system permease protein